MSKKRTTKPTATRSSRIAEIRELPRVARDNRGKLREVLAVLTDDTESERVRLEALRSLQATTFDPTAFAPHRAAYVAALRSIAAKSDAPDLRTRALGILARAKDGMAQRKLLEGLRQPEKAVVTPEKALQLLSYDPKADAFGVARDIVAKPPNPAARRQAMRVLAADTTAAPMFERILRSKDEDADSRKAAAAALHMLRPDKLQATARDIVLEPGEDPEVQAASLTALTHFGASRAPAGDPRLLKRAGKLKDSASTNVKRGARDFLDRHKR